MAEALTTDKFKELMELMLEKQNKDLEKKISEKMDDVKNEMNVALKVVTERRDNMETEQVDLKEQMTSLVTEVKDLRNTIEGVVAKNKVKNHQPVHQPSSVTPLEQSPGRHVQDFLPQDPTDKKKALELLDLGRRTVSLHPFEQKDFDFEAGRGAKDSSEAKLWAVQTYLRYEMNIKSHVLATLSIENIFTPASENFNTVYVTFSSITEANTVYSYSRNMRREVTVGIFVPKEWQERLKALNHIAYGLRFPPSGQAKFNTRIKWGNSDLVLYKKEPGTRVWSVVNIRKPLPPIDMCAVENPKMSPAPGRAGRQALKRQRSRGSGSDTNSRRVKSREGRDAGDEGLAAKDDQGQVQDKGRDRGRVIAEESYCPASPAPVKKPQVFSATVVDSPIFKKSQSSPFRMNPLVL